MMYPAWPDAIRYECSVLDGETMVGTSTVVNEIAHADNIYSPLEGDPSFHIFYGADEVEFDEGTREVLAISCPDDVPVGTSIDNAAYFQQFEFGEGSELVVPTQMVIHNPTLDMFLGIGLFLIVMIFFIWFFRRPYDTY